MFPPENGEISVYQIYVLGNASNKKYRDGKGTFILKLSFLLANQKWTKMTKSFSVRNILLPPLFFKYFANKAKFLGSRECFRNYVALVIWITNIMCQNIKKRHSHTSENHLYKQYWGINTAWLYMYIKKYRHSHIFHFNIQIVFLKMLFSLFPILCKWYIF